MQGVVSGAGSAVSAARARQAVAVLAVVASGGPGLDAGSVGLALSRRWSDAGNEVLFVDADPAGTRLAERYGEEAHAEFTPVARGLPSLIVARKTLTLRLLADHCYSISSDAGSLWALFGPDSAAGARFALGWLVARAEDLAVVHRERNVIVASSLDVGGDTLRPLLEAAPVTLVIAPVGSDEQAQALRLRCHRAGLAGSQQPHLLAVAGRTPFKDQEIGDMTGLEVAAHLPVLADEQVLGMRSGRRERDFFTALDHVAHRAALLLADQSWPSQPESPADPGGAQRPFDNADGQFDSADFPSEGDSPRVNGSGPSANGADGGPR